MESTLTMNEIVPNLWLGDLISALDVETLRSKGVQSVLSVMRGRVTVHETFIRRQVPLDDLEDEDILTHMGPSVKFIEKELASGRGVLVHCQAGVSRSATIVAAYLMSSRHLSRMDALALIRAKRPFIDPNFGFVKQLDLFHEAGYTVSQDNQAVRRWYLKRQAEHMRVEKYYPLEEMGIGSPDAAVVEHLETAAGLRYPDGIESGFLSRVTIDRVERGSAAAASTSTAPPESMLASGQVASTSPSVSLTANTQLASAGPTRKFRTAHAAAVLAGQANAAEAERLASPTKRRIVRCRMCRVELAGRDHMFEHVATDVSHPTLGEEPTQEDETRPMMANPSCSGYFVEPLKWMSLEEYKGCLSGKILCPNKRCKAKIGNYTWLGVQCGCGAWVVPSFCLGRGKVDEITVG